MSRALEALRDRWGVSSVLSELLGVVLDGLRTEKFNALELVLDIDHVFACSGFTVFYNIEDPSKCELAIEVLGGIRIVEEIVERIKLLHTEWLRAG